jgi:hypothetical protein
LLLVALLSQGQSQVQVGRVTAIYWPGEANAARTLAEAAESAGPFPGIPGGLGDSIRLILAGTAARFDSLTGGRLPEWGTGVAFPAAKTIVLRMKGDVRKTLDHEMAHLALHSVVERVPVWFDEGYASRAAGEWTRLAALRVNWALMTGTVPSFGQVNRDVRSSAAHAETAYALATAAVLLLERLGGERGLEQLLTNLAATQDFDRALRTTHNLTLGQFEALWQRDLRKRYGWVLFFGSFTVFWTILAIVLLSLWAWRRRRDKARRAALDQGWIFPSGDWNGLS